MPHPGMMHPLVGVASWFSVLPMESRSTDLHYNNSSKLQHTQKNNVPSLPSHIILILEVGEVGVMAMRGDVEHSRLSPN